MSNKPSADKRAVTLNQFKELERARARNKHIKYKRAMTIQKPRWKKQANNY